MYSPHPYRWRPGTELRHATTDQPTAGQEFTALCGAEETADTSDMAWLRPTCTTCNVRAHELVGLPVVVPVDEPEAAAVLA